MSEILIAIAVIAYVHGTHETVLCVTKNARCCSTGLTTKFCKENEMAEQSVAGVEYRAIEGYPLYRVGSDGSVWSLNAGGTGIRKHWKQMRGAVSGYGYRIVGLHNKEVSGKSFFVHRLVLEAFVGPCPDGMEACHFPDRDPLNNNLANLRWGTSKENHGDKVVHGTLLKGAAIVGSILNDQTVVEIRRRFSAGGVNMLQLATEYGVSDGTIRDLVKGRTWKHCDGPIENRLCYPQQRLTDDDVREIRRRYPLEGRAFASEFGISPQTLYGIATYRKRKNVA